MPIFESDGQLFDVEDKYVSDFAKEYPNAVTKVDSEEAIYEVSASDYPAYLDTQRAPRRVVPEKTTIPGSHAKPYQITPEEMGFENVLDKDNFQERYGVSPSVMERQTDPIKESVQRLRAKVGSRSNIPQYPIGNRYTFGFGSDYANKEADNIASSQLSAATENELRGAEKAQSKEGFWKSFGKGLKDEGMWTQGLTELDNNLTLAYIAKKAEKEGFDNLPEKEQDLLTASALRIASEAANSDEKTALQIAGMSTAESIPYMLQFMLTSSPASLATSPVRSAIKKAAEKAIKSGISSKLIPVVKGAARTAAVGAKATAMTAMQPTMYADAVSRGTGRATLENGKYSGMEEAESAPMAAYKAFANATIENLSEHSGSMLSGATRAAGNVLKKVPALGGFISNVQKNNVLSGVNKMMKAVGFNGAPEEFFEEQVSTGLNSLLVGDSQFSDFVDWKQQLATLISVGATAGAMTTTGTIMSVPYKKEIKRKYEEATDKVYDYFTPEEFDQFSSSLSRMDIDSRPDFIAQVSDMKGFAPEQIKGLVEFATRQAQFDGYAGAVSDYIEEEKVRAQEEIDRVSNKNMGEVIQVNGFGENPVNIVGGFVVFDDEGFVDKKRSSQTIYYLDEDGKRKMASPDKFGELVSRKPLADAYAEALGNVENDILIQEENDLAEEDTPEQAQQDAMILAENGNQVETPDGVGEIAFVEEDENAAIVRLQDGRAKRYAISVLKPYKPIDPNAEAVVEGQPAANGEQTVQTNEAIPEAVQTEQGVQAPSFPLDKEGNIDYSQINEPEQYAQALQQEFEGDAVSVIDEQIQSAQAKLEKAGKNTDAIKKRRAMKVAQMELDRLNNVKSLLTPSEQIVNETIPETVENEEASPSEQSNVTDLSQLTEPERRRYVVDNSTDPIELAEIYEQSKDEVDYAQMMPWEAALVGRKVSKDSFIENSDKNNITGAMNKSWFSKDGKSLDVLAQELSEFGVPVTEQDIVNFMMAHPGNSVKKRSQLSIDADRRFKETVKALTGQDVGGVESSSGKLILAGLRAGQRSEQERQALPFSTYTIPDSVLNFFEETGINPEDFDTFEELRDAVAKEQENGTFVFPLGETDLQIINNIINHGIEQQQDYANFAARVEKAGTKRAIEQPIFETEPGNQLQPIEDAETGTEGEQVDIEPTPEEIAEIESQLEVKKRPDNIFEAISEIALEQDIRDAEKEVNTTPTEAQKEAGNFKMGHVNIQGLDVSIENPKGSQRFGKDDTGKEWSVTLNNSYGYIKGTRGKDGDHVDVFLGDNPSSENVFVIDQINKDGSFDEHKVMLGFNSQEEAEAAYKSNYSEGWTGLGSVTPMTVDDFKAWVTEGKKNEPATQEIAEDVPTNEELVEDEFFTEDESKYMDEADSISKEFGDFSEEENKQVYNIVKSKVKDRGLKSGAAIQINNKQKVLSRAKDVVRDRARIESDGAKASAYYEYKNQIKSYKDGVEKTGLSISEADAIYLQAIKEVKSAPIESLEDVPEETDMPEVEAKKENLSTESLPSTAKKIEDFGEKIGGAKKDLAKEYRDKMGRVTEDDVRELPLSKSFPRPDFKKLVEGGVITENQAIYMNYMYDRIKAKPRNPYQIGKWSSDVKGIIDLFNAIVDGKTSPNMMDEIVDKAKGSKIISDIAVEMEAYNKIMKELGFPKNSMSMPYSVRKQWDGTYYITSGKSIVKTRIPTFDEAINSVIDMVGKPKSKKEVKLEIYQRVADKKYYIAKKLPGKNPIQLSQDFDTLKEARDFLKENNDALIDQWEMMSATQEERRGENRPRKGADWRQGKDITPEKFSVTFGFRGVEFGNWVKKDERQGALNDAYDSLMDLSSVLGISPKSLSLGGQLGLAFGARGGGKASAHYEPGKVVINLTKTKGAGSLAHEWFHALDNYFSRMRGDGEGFMTNNPRRKLNDTTRQEMLDAFKAITDAISASGVYQRSKKLDSTRSKNYWTEQVEMAARSFESYVISKLNDRGEHNDYLANVKDMNEWSAGQEASMETYPYPNAEESPIIGEKFDQLFQTIEEKEDEEGNQILFRDGQSETDQIKSEAEKNGTFLKAPNGKDSNLNENQWLQVRTKAFKEWFGDWENDPENASKVVDENGEPLVVYHGSRNGKFDVFNPSKGNPTLGGGMYFSDSIELSKKFAGTKGFVYSVFLNIKNPMYGQFNGSGSDMSRSEYRDGGIFTKSNTDRYANEGEKEYIVFESNQIKSATDNTGEFNPSNDEIRFREAEESLPEVKNGLVVLHNISSENLVKASRVGGLAMPSLAITKSDNQFLGFGDITLIGDKKMIDPKIKGNKVFGADAYTPTYPNIEYKVNNLDELHKETDKLPDRYRTSIENALINNIEDDGDSYLYENRYVRILFALSKGADIVKYNTVKSSVMSDYVRSIEAYDYFDIKDKEAIKQKMSEIFISELSDNAKSFYEKKGLIKNGSLSDDVIKRVFNSTKDEIRKEGTVDSNNTYDSALSFIEENNLSSEIKEYASNLYEKLNVSERIFKGYSQSGKRQYTSHTVENAVKDMRKEGIRGVQGMAGGLGRLRARLTPEFKSVDEIKSKQNKLKNKEDLKEAVDSIQEEYYSLHEELKPYYKWNSERIVDSMSDLEEEISDLLKNGSSESFNKLPEDLHEGIKKFAKDVVSLPTEYFEAKPQRAVYFSDFSAALIPSDSSDKIRDILTKNGIPFKEYSTNEERVSIVQDLSKEMGLRFREGDTKQEGSNVEKEATTLADSLNTPIRVVRDVNEITNDDKRKEKRMRSAKGWYDPKTGEVTIVLPNAESVGDVQATILHEVVGHKGLRGLLGDKFEEMMDKIYKHLPKKERQKIMSAAMDKYKFDYRTATEEYLAEFVERDVMEPSLWQKIKSAIKSFFRNMGVNLEMSDPDIAYLLWKSKNRLQGGDALSKINSVAKDLEAKERFREAPYTEADVLSDQLDDASKRAWESLSRDQRTVHEIVNETAELRKGVLKYFPTKEGVKKSIYELTQGLFDNAVSLKALQNLVNEVSNEPIESYANPYQFLTTIPARNEHKMKTFVKTKFSKIGQAIKEMGVPQSTVQVYAYLKHGIERNRYMRGRDIEDKTRKLQEEAEKRIDPIRDSIEYLSQQLETADKKNTQRILAKIEGYNQAILDIQSETQVKASEYAQKVEDKDYSGVFQVADLFIQEMEDRKMTVAQIESAIEQFEKEHDTTNFWEAVNGATKWTVQNEFEMGRISKEVRDKIFSMYDYYIPLKGWEEENANEVWDYMSGQGIPVSPIKKAGGRKSLAQNPFENIGLAAQTSIMGGHKNLLKLHALRMVRNYPNKLYRVSEVWVVDEGDNLVMKAPEYSDNAETYAENVTKFEEEMNELKEQGLAKKVMGKLDVGKPITKYEAKEHEVLVYENGKPYIIYVNDNPDIARAINMTSTKPYEVGGNDPSGKNGLKWAANQTMRLMRFTGQNLTSRNPAFVAANLLMDTQWAIAAASAKEGSAYAKKLVGNYMSSSVHASILRGVRGKLDESNPMDKMFADFQRAGGETGYSDLFKLEDFQKMLKEGLNEGTDWRKIYTWYTGSIDMLNRWAELASRFSTFVTSRNSGRDIERSAYDAKEITLNFNRKGTGAFFGNWLKFAYLFAGAGLQGAYSMANLALSKRSQKRITMVFAGTAMLGLIIPLINDMFLGGDDDELYSKKPDYERKSNFLIRIPGSDSFFKIPISQPLRPFYNIGETLYQMVKGNRNAGEGAMDIIGGFGMLLPFDPFGGSSLMPSAFQPIYQVKENKDFFGQKIYKDDSFTQYDPEFKRAFSNTSPAFVELTRALNEITGGDEVTKGWANVNPAILEHLVEGYLGGAFKFVNDIGKQVNGAIEVSKGNAYPYDSRSYPIVGRFYTNTAATSDINSEYYKVINDSEELGHRVRKYQELGRKGDQEAFEKSLELMSSPEYKKAIFVKAFKKKIDNLKKTAKEGNMENNPVLKDQERELKIIMLNEIEKLDEK